MSWLNLIRIVSWSSWLERQSWKIGNRQIREIIYTHNSKLKSQKRDIEYGCIYTYSKLKIFWHISFTEGTIHLFSQQSHPTNKFIQIFIDNRTRTCPGHQELSKGTRRYFTVQLFQLIRPLKFTTTWSDCLLKTKRQKEVPYGHHNFWKHCLNKWSMRVSTCPRQFLSLWIISVNVLQWGFYCG